MWKDFFYYTQSERKAVYVLLVLIALLLVFVFVVSERKQPMPIGETTADSVSLKAFASAVQKQDKPKKRKQQETIMPLKADLKPFDPNLADSIELLRLGLSPYVVRNVMKYRQKGGRFSTPESFARIYGLTDDVFRKLKPYIRIAVVPKPLEQNTFKENKSERTEEIPKLFKYPEGTLIDVNLADTTELKKIPGIGSGIAKAIVGYRTRLGGFFRLEQLMEIKYVTPEMMKWFKLDYPVVRKLSINRESLDKLRSHPYLDFYQAKVIVEYRKKKGKIKSLSQLSLYEEFAGKDLELLSAYISFD